ncbi:MAG: NAD(P)/FAD-dependent oxidoreductase [Desulfurococcaceae archaeon]
MKEYDVAIIGGGPAGIYAAVELIKLTGKSLKIALFDRGARVEERSCPITREAIDTSGSYTGKLLNCGSCVICHILYGIGGAGTFSSGTVNLRPDIGGDLDKLLGSWEKAEEVIKYVDKILLEFGAPQETLLEPETKKIRSIEKLVAKAGAKFIPATQRVLGSENVIKVVYNITKFLEENNVKIFSFTSVIDIANDQDIYKLNTSSGDFYAHKVLLAPGRGGARWFKDIAERLGIEVEPGPLDIGVRVEVPYYITEHIVKVNYDPKVVMYTRSYDDMVRTFCTNPQGYVIKEMYDDGTVGVNGESYNTVKSKNTNFALLVTLKLTVPYTDVLELGKSIARIATKVGIGKPIIQRLGDLEKGRRSTWDRISRSVITPTLRDSTPGDISLVLPQRVMENILEAIERLDILYPGLASPQTLLYAPEIKYYSVKAKINEHFETTAPSVYVAGDGVGLSRGINVAAATGVLAARGIVRTL